MLTCGLAMLTWGCTTMQLERYPEASPNSVTESGRKNGISLLAQPLLDKEASKKYFGVDLLDKGILAIHLTIRNENPSSSFMVHGEDVRVTDRPTAGTSSRPEGASQDAGVVSAVGGVLMSPLLLAVAIQQLSDASVIEENFEAKRLRTKTLDPGQHVAGFAYFNWEQIKERKAADLCVDVVESVGRVSFPFCVLVDFDRPRH